MRPYPDRRNLSDHGAVAPSANDPAQNGGHNDRVQQRNAGPGFENSAAHERLGTMNRRKFLAGSAATLTGSGLLVGTQGTSQVESHRNTQIETVCDGKAYLRMVHDENGNTIEFDCDPRERIEFDCKTDIQITLKNQAKEDLDKIQFDPVIEGEGVTIENVDVPGSLALGQKDTIDVTVECDGKTEGSLPTLSFGIEVGGDDTWIEAHRSHAFELECDCSSEETAYAYGGNKNQSSQDAACAYKNNANSDNPFGYLFETCGGQGNGGDGNYCQGQWGWFITEDQIKNSVSFPLYAGADGYDLGSATEVGTVYANFNNDGTKLFVNYSFKDKVDNKRIIVEDTAFTVVDSSCGILDNNNGVVPSNWSYSDQNDGQYINVDGMNVVLAAHAVVTLTKNTS